MNDTEDNTIGVDVKPAVNGRVEIHSLEELCEQHAPQLKVSSEVLLQFARKLIPIIKWDFLKGAQRGIEQVSTILRDPEHERKLKDRRKKQLIRDAEREQERQVENLVRSADPIGRLRSLKRERKLYAEMAKRCETEMAVLRRDWGDVIPPEAWEEEAI